MRTENGGIEQHAKPALAKAVTKLDVFDGRPAIAVIEAADAAEDRLADSAATGPERLRIRRAVLVNEVVREILPLGDEVRRSGPRVVRTEHRIHIGTVFEKAADLSDGAGAIRRAGVNADVGVEEQKHVAGGFLGAEAASGGGSAAAARRKDGNPEGRGDPGAVVGGTVVDHEDLLGPAGRLLKRAEGLAQGGGPVVHGNDYRDGKSVQWRRSRSHASGSWKLIINGYRRIDTGNLDGTGESPAGITWAQAGWARGVACAPDWPIPLRSPCHRPRGTLPPHSRPTRSTRRPANCARPAWR